ncbi:MULTISPECIES: hypothetical protein [Pseudomonas]|nr:hypothetical protein [Pseudomonas sp. FW305-70]
MCKTLPEEPTTLANLETLANNPLMVMLGAPGSRERMLQLLAENDLVACN